MAYRLSFKFPFQAFLPIGWLGGKYPSPLNITALCAFLSVVICCHALPTWKSKEKMKKDSPQSIEAKSDYLWAGPTPLQKEISIRLF